MNTSMIKIEGLTFSYGKKASVFKISHWKWKLEK